MTAACAGRNLILGPLALVLLAALAVGSPPPDESLTGADMAAIHRGRRNRLAPLVGEGTLLLFSEPDQTPYLTRPEPNLRYLTGVTEPRCALVLAIAKGEDGTSIVKSERLYLPAASRAGALWTGRRLSPGDAASAVTGIADTRDSRRLFEDLFTEPPVAGRLFVLVHHDPGPRLRDRMRRYREKHPDLDVHDALGPLAKLRAVKDAEEIARVRRACALTARGLVDCMKEARPGMWEYQLQARLEFACRAGGAVRQSFSSIVASGPDATTLHYIDNCRRSLDGELVLMDVGAEYMGYAADVSRTFPLNGRFSEEQAALYDAVLAAQIAGIRTVRSGSSLRDAQAAATKVLAARGLDDAFPHAIGHHVGLDVHDPAPTGTLEAGMIVTIEPGIYLPERGIGIRIEDTVLVTETGCEILSDAVPKTRTEIEKLMSR